MEEVRKQIHIYKREEYCVYYLIKALERMIHDEDMGIMDYFYVTRMIQSVIEKDGIE